MLPDLFPPKDTMIKEEAPEKYHIALKKASLPKSFTVLVFDEIMGYSLICFNYLYIYFHRYKWKYKV